ncbi:alpha-ketoacid dehydrogenase subunit beta [Spongiibacter sp. KMU-166]|uniref:Alpha-ketoacid dehydrogenase subunit beta n=1 Tax=Spongiibacter thalassae TaxID=2721624 RepID=A0ABX1GB35_9GAMM|nr:alpha-ketoacid dehydrogenase subunit beta [Spongiibacter thalassae]NKI16369.1 alpha-ketoacid dehydrogenase subunit beta [Spongiibacter thalassae]
MVNTEEQTTVIQALNAAMADAMEQDDSIFLLGEDIADPEEGGVAGVTAGLSTRFGDSRVRSTPISEQAIVGAGIGAALNGMRPVLEIMMMNFATVAMDMIVNHAAKLRFMSGGQTQVPLTIRMATGAGLSTAGQHADYLEAWFAHTAGLKVVTYSNPADAYGLLQSCIFDNDPCIFIENFLSYSVKGGAPEKGSRVPLGKAKVVREGSDLTIVCYGAQVSIALSVAEKFAAEGVSVEVVDLRTISPWDQETVFTSVAKTGRLVVSHEALKAFGVGAEIAAVVQQELWSSLKAPVRRAGAPTCPVPYSRPLELAFMTSVEDLETEARLLLK